MCDLSLNFGTPRSFKRALVLGRTMNKLKKPPSLASSSPVSQKNTFSPTVTASMTMQYAATPTRNGTGASRSAVNQPVSATDHYWAARALKAEALLAAQEAHQKEVKTLGHHQEMKRERELSLVAKEYKEKLAALERLLIFLLILIAVLVVLIIYLATFYTRHSISLHNKYQPGWWSAIGASHFTIPILSPFTSVVEHESSVIGAKSIGTLAVISACLVYFIFRYWISHRNLGTTGTSISSSASSAARAVISSTSRAIDR